MPRSEKTPPPLAPLARIWPPMLAVTGVRPSTSAETHLLELKYDGVRAVAGVVRGKASLQVETG